MTPWDEEADRALEYVVNIPVGLPVVTSPGLQFDTSALTAFSSNGVSTFTATTPITVGSGLNRALLVIVFFTGASRLTSSSPTATWAGANIGSGGAPLAGPYNDGSNIGDIFFFGMAAPASGANNLVLSWAGGNQAIAALISFTGADQTGGTTTFYGATGQTANFGNSAAATIVGPSAAGDISVAGYLCDAGFSGGQGNIDIGFNSGGALWGMAANYAAAGASPTLTYSRAVAQNWVAGAIAVKHL